jgi:hypothetical protein
VGKAARRQRMPPPPRAAKMALGLNQRCGLLGEDEVEKLGSYGVEQMRQQQRRIYVIVQCDRCQCCSSEWPQPLNRLDKGQMTEKDEFEAKHKELEGIVIPIIEEKIETALQEKLKSFDKNKLTEKDEFEAKGKELEGIVASIIDERIEKVVRDKLDWQDKDRLTEKDAFENKQKELESTVAVIIKEKIEEAVQDKFGMLDENWRAEKDEMQNVIKEIRETKSKFDTGQEDCLLKLKRIESKQLVIQEHLLNKMIDLEMRIEQQK